MKPGLDHEDDHGDEMVRRRQRDARDLLRLVVTEDARPQLLVRPREDRWRDGEHAGLVRGRVWGGHAIWLLCMFASASAIAIAIYDAAAIIVPLTGALAMTKSVTTAMSDDAVLPSGFHYSCAHSYGQAHGCTDGGTCYDDA